MKPRQPKVDKLRNNVKGSKGFSWDNGDIVFDKRPVVLKKKNGQN